MKYEVKVADELPCLRKFTRIDLRILKVYYEIDISSWSRNITKLSISLEGNDTIKPF